MTTGFCHHCGQEIVDRAEWHGLMVSGLGEVFWRGLRWTHFAPAEAALLMVLARRGEATRFALEMVTTRNSTRSVDVHVSRIRRKLIQGGVPIAIRSIRGMGYRLVLDA